MRLHMQKLKGTKLIFSRFKIKKWHRLVLPLEKFDKSSSCLAGQSQHYPGKNNILFCSMAANKALSVPGLGLTTFLCGNCLGRGRRFETAPAGSSTTFANFYRFLIFFVFRRKKRMWSFADLDSTENSLLEPKL